jgi:peptide/nickel transport system substrate-binding protein
MIKKSLLLICLLCLVACKSSSERPYNDNTLRLNLSAEPSLLNPILSTDSASSSVEAFIFNGLLGTNEDLELVPELATHYIINDSGTEYTFHLKENVTWHDGHPFTAHDVKYTFETLLDPKTNTVRRSNFVINGKPIEILVINDHTVKFILPEPFSPFLVRVSTSILPKHILENDNINTSEFNRNPIGTGPYIFNEWRSGQYIKLSKNESYFEGSPKIDTVLFSVINDPNAALIALKKQEIYVAGIPPKDIKKIKEEPHIQTHSYYDLIYSYLAFNLENPHFKDRRVRLAITHALNKDALVKGVLKGHGQAAEIPSSPLLWSYPESELEAPKFDIEVSKQLLQDAGYILNSKTNILEKNGVPFEFTILTNKGNKEREKTAQIIQQALRQLNIKVNLQIMEWSAFLKIVNNPVPPKAFDAVILAWSLSIEPDAYSIWHSSQFPKGFNFIGYNNATVDQLLVKGRRETDQAKRKAIYEKMYSEIINDAPYVFLYYPETTIGTNKILQGLSTPGPSGLLNNKTKLYLKL